MDTNQIMNMQRPIAMRSVKSQKMSHMYSSHHFLSVRPVTIQNMPHTIQIMLITIPRPAAKWPRHFGHDPRIDEVEMEWPRKE